MNLNCNKKAAVLPKSISTDLETACSEGAGVEQGEHLRAVRNLADFIANPSVHVDSKLLLLERLSLLETSNRKDQSIANVTHTVTAKDAFLRLAFCTGDYSRDSMESPLLWEIRNLCILKVQQQRDHGWKMDQWIEMQRMCCCLPNFMLSTARNEDYEELYELYTGQKIMDPPVLAGLFLLRARQPATKTINDELVLHHRPFNEAIKYVAVFLASLAVSEPQKIAALSFLLRNTEEARHAYQFCIDPQIDTAQFEHHKCFVLWELRAICLYERQQEQIHHEQVMQAAGMAVDIITTTAECVHSILSGATELATMGMMSASDLVVSHFCADQSCAEPTTTIAQHIQPDSKVSVVVRTYCGAAKQATDHVRTVAAGTSRKIRTVSAHYLRQAATKLPVPPTHKTKVHAATNVAMACLGATATVGEAVFQSTGNLAQGATKAVSNIVQHQYGDTAGQVVQDVGDTVGNVIRTAKYVALLTGTSSLPRSVAKTTAKQHVRERSKLISSLDDDDTSSVIAEIGGKEVYQDPEASIPLDKTASSSSCSGARRNHGISTI